MTASPPRIPDLAGARAVARRHGVADAEVAPAAAQGIAGFVYLLGEDLVLKVARPEPEFAGDLRKEALVIPHARALGVRTPEVVEYAEADDGFDGAPYLVQRRAHGRGADGEPGAAAYRELGRELALLHAAPIPDAVRAGVPADTVGDPGPGIQQLAAQGELSPGLADWLTGWLAQLAQAAPTDPRPVLIHGDIAAGNLLLDARTGALSALLDWGDAAVADPATEFAKVPPRSLPHVLDGYLDALPGPADGRQWAARVLWHHLVWAVFRLPTPPEPGWVHWSAQPANRLLELLRAYAEGLPEPWAGWMRSQRLP
ncbi:phosphotransferase family protein [Streptomyces litchfieldiae]|uniref:Phosphotransferase n=1 Tax=Streptomyces litchfieldiae TaxID=3075543 RepID=A0ABU2ML22_9ACTN|nr:phosphotransferase [Streptomyces sp. DSM 44938]MDT0342181.1 phosphotransferase [Streptomyces sp. DSM 44938]